MLYISKGNSKMGKIPSISLPPKETCISNSICYEQGCYARNLMFYPEVKRQWTSNLMILKTDIDLYFKGVSEWMEINSPKIFRYHVGGDIISQKYLNNMVTIACKFSKTKFACFTKRYSLDFDSIPANLNIVLSCWPSINLPENEKLSRLWYQDGSELRIPSNAIKCKHSCENCLICWDTSQRHDIISVKKGQLRLFNNLKQRE